MINNLIEQVKYEHSPEAQEGKIIDYHFSDGNDAEVIVAGCEFDIGITLQCTNNPINNFLYQGGNLMDMRNQEVTCVHGPNSPTPYLVTPKRRYPTRFYSILRQIMDGKYSQLDGGTRGLTCAFSS